MKLNWKKKYLPLFSGFQRNISSKHQESNPSIFMSCFTLTKYSCFHPKKVIFLLELATKGLFFKHPLHSLVLQILNRKFLAESVAMVISANPLIFLRGKCFWSARSYPHVAQHVCLAKKFLPTPKKSTMTVNIFRLCQEQTEIRG